MKMFTMGPEDTIAVLGSGEAVPGGAAEGRFSTAAELARLVQSWPAARLVALWNALPDVPPVRRFTDRATAVRRIWRAVAQSEVAGPDKATKGKRPKRQAKAAAAVGNDTKAAEVLRLLRQPGGATLRTLMSATGWQAHSVRGFISRTAKLQRLKVGSVRTDDGRVYSIRH